MAKVIVVDEAQFDEAFDHVLDKLKLEKLEACVYHGADPEVRASYEELHRRFHYEVCILKETLKKL